VAELGRASRRLSRPAVNGVEPYAYLNATLEAIAAGHPSARIDELMPWNFDNRPDIAYDKVVLIRHLQSESK